MSIGLILGWRIEDLFKDQIEFSDKTFGTPQERGPLGPLNHLKSEVEELIQAPDDPYEYADALLLLVDAFRRTGRAPEEIFEYAKKKLEINKQRKWGKPDENGVIRHQDNNPSPIPATQGSETPSP